MLAKCGLDQGRKVVRTTIVQLDFDGMVYVLMPFVPLVHVQLGLDKVTFLVR